MSGIFDLLVRLEKFKGPDRELDARIHFECVTQHEPNFTNADRKWSAPQYYDTKQGAWGKSVWRYSPIDHAFGIRFYTESLDAALSLFLNVPKTVPSDPRKACIEALRQRSKT